MTEPIEEHKALTRRLRSAFANVSAPEKLADQIRIQIKQPVHSRLRNWSSLAAAVFFLIGLPLGWYFLNESTDHQAYAELVKIHQSNHTAEKAFFYNDDPDQLAEFFRKELGFSPQLPQLGQGLAILGCCVKHFRGQIVGSYVVDTDQGFISVIVVTDSPKSLGMKPQKRNGPIHQTFWEGSFAYCNMVTVRLGDYSYCAVGDMSHKELTALLERLLP